MISRFRLFLLSISMLFAVCSNSTFGDSTRTSPTDQEISPAEWRRQQLVAADKSEEIMRAAQKQNGLLAQYEYMQAQYDANNSRAFRLIFGQYLSWFQTWIADYDGARNSFSIAQPVQSDDGASPLNGNFHAVPAEEAILNLTKDRRAVFFNEAHSMPRTRTLTVVMLSRLRAQGYNYFAAETLYTGHVDELKKGYPTPKAGFYINEPIYGEMVRAALRLGYKVIAYDAENAGSGDPREREGARSLYEQVFKHDPGARLVVNAGFGHVQKQGVYLGGSSMAEFFQKISGIDPFVVEETMMVEHARIDQDHPYYLAAMQSSHPSVPFIYVDDTNHPWTLKPGKYDVNVFFPNDRESNEIRPRWASLGGARAIYNVGGEDCNNQFPCLIEARYADEGDDAVAADRALLDNVAPGTSIEKRIITTHGSAQSRLYLYPGRYRLTAMDRSGRTVMSRNIEIAAEPSRNGSQ